LSTALEAVRGKKGCNEEGDPKYEKPGAGHSRRRGGSTEFKPTSHASWSVSLHTGVASALKGGKEGCQHIIYDEKENYAQNEEDQTVRVEKKVQVEKAEDQSHGNFTRRRKGIEKEEKQPRAPTKLQLVK